ncbi:hypothetical protein [Photobacterium halotolerans]|uniref:Uncharacterized protein n=1 Tax=Photobacterium halotolerans TaxID=265726 RepID=A0A0F5VDW5_9GAMM|nr:hypothetical protein [Photobacterium halotolerans]KKD00361.1 hypothetical protein KY46_06780 [Photobacterium halotolerans]
MTMNYAEIMLIRYQKGLKLRLAIRWVLWVILGICTFGWFSNTLSGFMPDSLKIINFLLAIVGTVILAYKRPSLRRLRLRDHRLNSKAQIVRLDFLARRKQKRDEENQLKILHNRLSQRDK